MPTVTVSLRGLQRFRDPIRRRPRPIRAALNEWSKIYGKFIQRRFVKFSAGGGNWKQLAPSTIAAKGHNLILFRTGLMQNNLKPVVKSIRGVRTPGSQIELIMRFGGGQSYSGGLRLDTVIEFHDKGIGQARRRIFVAPDSITRNEMAIVMKKAIVRSIILGNGG